MYIAGWFDKFSLDDHNYNTVANKDKLNKINPDHYFFKKLLIGTVHFLNPRSLSTNQSSANKNRYNFIMHDWKRDKVSTKSIVLMAVYP